MAKLYVLSGGSPLAWTVDAYEFIQQTQANYTVRVRGYVRRLDKRTHKGFLTEEALRAYLKSARMAALIEARSRVTKLTELKTVSVHIIPSDIEKTSPGEIEFD